jgi:BMFP domain-containing protein YqiC
MIDGKKIDEFMQNVANALPAGLLDMKQDVEDNVRSAMTGAFAKLDLVTREEFDVQSQVLLRTREKLEALEKLVADLEGKTE